MQPDIAKLQSKFPIELLAHYVRKLPLHDKFRLVELVPELNEIKERHQEVIPPEQTELINHFTSIVNDESPAVSNSEVLIEDLTFDEFLLLAEEEQSKIWSAAHAKAEAELDATEVEVQPNAIPAG